MISFNESGILSSSLIFLLSSKISLVAVSFICTEVFEVFLVSKFEAMSENKNIKMIYILS